VGRGTSSGRTIRARGCLMVSETEAMTGRLGGRGHSCKCPWGEGACPEAGAGRPGLVAFQALTGEGAPFLNSCISQHRGLKAESLDVFLGCSPRGREPQVEGLSHPLGLSWPWGWGTWGLHSFFPTQF
jgi:hypothetical protein